MFYKHAIKWCAGFLYAGLLAPFVYNTNWFQSFVSPKVLWFCVWVDCACAVWLCILFLRKETIRYTHSPVLAGLCVFGLSLSVSSLVGVDVVRSVWGILPRFQGLFVWWHCIIWTALLVYLFRASKAYRQSFVAVAIWVALGAAVYGIVEFMFGSVFFTDANLPRAASFFGNPIYFANYLTIPLFLSLYRCVYAGKQEWVYRWAIPVLLLCGVLASVSRGALVGLAVGAAVMAVVWVSGRQNIHMPLFSKKAFMGVVLMGLVATLVVYRTPVFKRLLPSPDQNVTSRLVLWDVAWNGFVHHPFLGVGLENFSFVINQFFDSRLYGYNAEWSDKPHNAFLEVAVTGGVIGVCAYLSIWVSAVWVLRRARVAGTLTVFESAALTGGLVAYAVQNLFSFDTPAALMMFCLCLAVAGSYGAREPGHLRPGSVRGAVLVGIGGAAAVLGMALYVYRPTVHVLKALASEEVLRVAGTSESVSELRQILADRFVWDRGYVSLLHADAVLTKAYTSTDENRSAIVQAINGLEPIAAQSPRELKYWLKLEDLYIREAVLAGAEPDTRAEKALAQAQALAPQRAEVWFAQAALRASQHKPDEALLAVEEALQRKAYYPQAVWLQIRLLVESGSVAVAEARAESALAKAVWPRRVEELQWLFDAYDQQQMAQKSVGLLDKAVEYYKDNRAFQFNAAEAYIRIGAADKARTVLYRLQSTATEAEHQRITNFLDILR